MPEYRIDFDYTEYGENYVGTDSDTGYDIYEDVVEDYSGTYYVNADSEIEAHDKAEEELSLDYTDVYIWGIEEQ